ncbi:hypothetical protein ACNUI5_25500 [Pseudomonas aeruginosa]
MQANQPQGGNAKANTQITNATEGGMPLPEVVGWMDNTGRPVKGGPSGRYHQALVTLAQYQCDVGALQAEIERERLYREILCSANAGLAEKVDHLGGELDAAQARVAELEMLLRKLSTNGLMQFSTADEEMAVQAALGGAPVAQAQHSVPEGWKLVPSDKGCVTSSMKAECIGEFSFYIRAACAECLDVGTDSDCHVCGGDIEYDQKIDVPWDTCKEIYKAMLAAAPGKEVPQAWHDVQAERRRQIEAEGWTPEHDDAHSHGQMARAAACYALAGSSAPNDGTAALLVSLAWPWDEQWWKPSTARRDMVKACTLALAEIERLDRAAAALGGAV